MVCFKIATFLEPKICFKVNEGRFLFNGYICRIIVQNVSRGSGSLKGYKTLNLEGHNPMKKKYTKKM